MTPKINKEAFYQAYGTPGKLKTTHGQVKGTDGKIATVSGQLFAIKHLIQQETSREDIQYYKKIAENIFQEKFHRTDARGRWDRFVSALSNWRCGRGFQSTDHMLQKIQAVKTPAGALPIESPSSSESFDEFKELLSELASDSVKGHLPFSKTLQQEKWKPLFEVKDQEKAKETFAKSMKKILGSEVTYVSASSLKEDFKRGRKEDLPDQITFNLTKGVGLDIKLASQDPKSIHLISVASQYNCAESSSEKTPAIGQAMAHSKEDATQGPEAQRTNPLAFELVTAFLTHLGFNMMDKVLPPSVGKTYPTEAVPKTEDGKTTILHGYFKPAGWFNNAGTEQIEKSTKNVAAVAKHMKQNIAAFETVCYSSKIPDGGPETVHLILAAAPCASALFYSEEEADIEYLAAVANFTTQLEMLKNLSEKEPQKTAVLHVTLSGLGVFGNKPGIIAQAFKDSVLHFYDKLEPEQKQRMRVQIDVFEGSFGVNENAQTVLDILKLNKNSK